MREIKLVPKSKNSLVGKKYEDAILVGFRRDKNVILLTKIRNKKRSKSRTAWSPLFWKLLTKKQ